MWPAAEYGYTTPPPPYDKDYTKASTTRFLKKNYPSTEQDPSKSSLLVPPQRLHNPTDAHSETSCYTSASLQTGPVLLLNPASQWHHANLAPTPTMWTTCPDTFLPALHSTFYTPSPPNHPIPRHYGRHCNSTGPNRRYQNYRPPICARPRWCESRSLRNTLG